VTAFEKAMTAAPEDIDELGHVNNAAWVRWIQDMATSHWNAVAPPAHREAYVWVVTRHEIDYLRAVGPGETVTGRTWVGEAPKGARFDRHVEFVGEDGKLRVRAKTTWAIIDRKRGGRFGCPTRWRRRFLTSASPVRGGDRAAQLRGAGAAPESVPAAPPCYA
jgi:acyl-CoA thioester hydrolase